MDKNKAETWKFLKYFSFYLNTEEEQGKIGDVEDRYVIILHP